MRLNSHTFVSQKKVIYIKIVAVKFSSQQEVKMAPHDRLSRLFFENEEEGSLPAVLPHHLFMFAVAEAKKEYVKESSFLMYHFFHYYYFYYYLYWRMLRGGKSTVCFLIICRNGCSKILII